MAKLNILEFPDPRLTTVARPVESFDESLKKLVEDMTETMYAANGIGLAATQVNIHKRLLVLDVSETNSVRYVHGFFHVLYELFQCFAEVCHFSSNGC